MKISPRDLTLVRGFCVNNVIRAECHPGLSGWRVPGHLGPGQAGN